MEEKQFSELAESVGFENALITCEIMGESNPYNLISIDKFTEIIIKYQKGLKLCKNATKRKQISPKDRWNIYKRDNFRCIVCGSTKDITIDHIIPVCKGGTNDATNYVTLCSECNLRKKDGTYLDILLEKYGIKLGMYDFMYKNFLNIEDK